MENKMKVDFPANSQSLHTLGRSQREQISLSLTKNSKTIAPYEGFLLTYIGFYIIHIKMVRGRHSTSENILQSMVLERLSISHLLNMSRFNGQNYSPFMYVKIYKRNLTSY